MIRGMVHGAVPGFGLDPGHGPRSSCFMAVSVVHVPDLPLDALRGPDLPVDEVNGPDLPEDAVHGPDLPVDPIHLPGVAVDVP